MENAASVTLPHVWSVTELTNALRRTLEATFAMIDLEGEVSGYKRYPSGHAYWTLKDSDSQLAAVMFRAPFEAAKAAQFLRDGARVKVRGRVTVGLRSQYQIVVTRVRPLGEGELMQRYLELRAKLEAEGLFASDKKRALPFLPRRIAIITSGSGAVVHDMCRVLMRRFPHLEIRIYPAVVQGPQAPASLMAGFQYFNSCRSWQADVILFGRGGGSFEDLFCFNDEALVRTIAASRIPTISAVGHETDFTLADFAADVRAGTPSMAAELAVREYDALARQLDKARASLASALRGTYEWTAQRVDGFARELTDALWRAETQARARVDAAESRLAVASAKLFAKTNLLAQQIANREQAMMTALNLRQVKDVAQLTELETKLMLLSPYSVLNRGYSLTTDDAGHIIRDVSELADGQRVHTRVQKGSFTAVVSARDDS